jgi:hypothetical protein
MIFSSNYTIYSVHSLSYLLMKCSSMYYIWVAAQKCAKCLDFLSVTKSDPDSNWFICLQRVLGVRRGRVWLEDFNSPFSGLLEVWTTCTWSWVTRNMLTAHRQVHVSAHYWLQTTADMLLYLRPSNVLRRRIWRSDFDVWRIQKPVPL